ncbi:nuclear factor of activated T-cells, cytoplasmic 4-like, partial [Cetorhinus maximus]
LLGYAEKPLTLQMFIGTADDRNLRPHAFYQVHRITGKMVATSSQEAVVGTTKVLEVSLLPENNMTANIDCAGILKLRNSDIELRKGETDIGRKNTRVKLVFRVHIPQPNGKVVSLQASSVPIECSQRSAHELPQVESYSVTSCPVTGGEELLLTGCNFLPESKVIFIEKGPEGRPQWEVEAKVNRAKSTESLILAEVPPYHNQSLTSTAPVLFLVCNGKRKRSPCQSFQYLPVLIKEEPYEGLLLGPPSPLRTPARYPLDPASCSPPVPRPDPACPGPGGIYSEAGPLSPPPAPFLLSLLGWGGGEAGELPPPTRRGRGGHPPAQRHRSCPLTQADRGPPPGPQPRGPSASYSPPACWAASPLAPPQATPPATPPHPPLAPPPHAPVPLATPPRLAPPRAPSGSYSPPPPWAASRPARSPPPGFLAGPVPEAPAYGPCAYAGGLGSPGGLGSRPFPGSPEASPGRVGAARRGTAAAERERDVRECELPFRTISIQGITLDDVNEVIGRDLTDVHDPLGVGGAADSP